MSKTDIKKQLNQEKAVEKKKIADAQSKINAGRLKSTGHFALAGVLQVLSFLPTLTCASLVVGGIHLAKKADIAKEQHASAIAQLEDQQNEVLAEAGYDPESHKDIAPKFYIEESSTSLDKMKYHTIQEKIDTENKALGDELVYKIYSIIFSAFCGFATVGCGALRFTGDGGPITDAAVISASIQCDRAKRCLNYKKETETIAQSKATLKEIEYKCKILARSEMLSRLEKQGKLAQYNTSDYQNEEFKIQGYEIEE